MQKIHSILKSMIRSKLLPWLVIGIVLRLALMPIAAHNDYLDSHWRSQTMASGNVIYPGRFQYLSHAVDALWMLIISPAIPDGINFFEPPERLKDVMFAEIEDFDAFVHKADVRWVIFLTKIPYLVADLIAAFLLLKLFERDREKRTAFAMWMINPPLLYAVYIFGRYETYALLSIVAGLVLAQRGKNLWAGFCIGLAVAFRATPFLLVPAFALGLSRVRWKQLAIFLLGVAPNLVIVLINEGVFGLDPAPYALSLVVRTGPIGMLTTTIVEGAPLMPFFFAYMLLLLWLDRKSASWKRVVQASLTIYLLIYVFTWHSAHYIVWLTPFIIPLLTWRPDYFRYYLFLLVAWFVYWLFATDAGVFTNYLFSPLYGEVRQLHPIKEELLPHLTFLHLDLNQLIALFRSLLGAMAAWLIYQTLKIQLDQESQDPSTA